MRRFPAKSPEEMPDRHLVEEQWPEYRPAPERQCAVLTFAEETMGTLPVRDTEEQEVAAQPGDEEKPPTFDQAE